MSDWLHRLAYWVDDVEWRVRQWWRAIFPPPEPPRMIGPVPPVHIQMRQIQLVALEAFAQKSDMWEFFKEHAPTPEVTHDQR